jgi:hypothetical protein
VSLIRGRTGDLEMLLGLCRVLVPLHMIVLAVMLRGSAMRLGNALVTIGRFRVIDWA